jgi:MFS family permease
MNSILLDVNAPESRGAVFSIFNLTDSLGTGFGQFVAGSLSGLFGLTISLAICSGFWVVCAVLLVIVVYAFVADMERNRERLRAAADEMRLQADAR